jgi:hypothetical protein
MLPKKRERKREIMWKGKREKKILALCQNAEF